MYSPVPCNKPLTAYKLADGQITFKVNDGWSGRQLELPCGQCYGCRIDLSRQWALRCVHEAQMHEKNCFVTLTYRDEDLPRDNSLDVADWQLFAKRLREKIGSFRFFHCGEYGSKTERPHYHALIFGHDFSGDRVTYRKLKDYKVYTSQLLEETWKKGFCTVGDLTYESAAYCARYILKKVNGSLGKLEYARFRPDTGEIYHVRPEYVTMSRRPGVGSEWFKQFSGDVFPRDEVVYEGRRFRPPRFYDNKLDEYDLEAIKERRCERVVRRKEDLTPEKLELRERYLEKTTDLFRRKV